MNKKNGCGMGGSVQCSVFRMGTHANRYTAGFKLGRFCRCLASSLRLSLRAKVSGFRFQAALTPRNLTPETKALSTVYCSLFTLLLLAAFASRAEAGVAATGGTMTTNGMYIVHTFTTVGSNSFNVSSGGNVEVLVVAGGGGGGYWGTQGAGGGAGGVTNNTAFAVVGGSNYTVTVGAGGLGSWGGPNATNVREATSGSNSVFGSITALGGGNGGSPGQTSGRGIGVVGSSGGLSQGSDANNLGTPGQGNNGGAGQPNANFGQGGGGGAGANGQAGTTTYGGKGGTGLYFSAFANWGDTSHLGYFGGGGGGGYRGGTATCGGTGGWGGGGTGGNQGGSPLNNGQANTGGGGGGADWKDMSTSSKAGDGGSGIVIVRYVGTAMPSQMKITFGGYTNRSEVLTNFPVLVVFSHNINNSGFTFANFATTNGYDLRFGTNSKPPTIGLNYEIESWNPNGASYIWVQVPTIPGDGSGAIWANWGNTSASNQLSCTTNGATWDSDYLSVWHMGQPNVQDSTTNQNVGYPSPTPTTTTAGLAGSSQDFTASRTNYTSFSNPFTVGAATVEAWINHRTQSGIMRYVTCGNESANIRFQSPNLHYYFVDSSSTIHHVQTDSIANGQWTHVVGTYDGTTQRLWKNGASIGSSTFTVTMRPAAGVGLSASGGEAFDGQMDEVRLSRKARSANWLWATYQTMASNTVFNTYGAMVKQPSPKGTVFVMR